jgi:hypothetical protein
MPGDGHAAAYRLHAEICAEIARQVSDPDTKLELLGMAQAWLRLAEQALKNAQPSVLHQVQESAASRALIVWGRVRDGLVGTISAQRREMPSTRSKFQ